MLIMPNVATPAPPNCYCSESRAHKRLNQPNFLTDELCIKAALGCTVGEEFLCVFSSAQRSNSSPRLSPNRMLKTARSQPSRSLIGQNVEHNT